MNKRVLHAGKLASLVALLAAIALTAAGMGREAPEEKEKVAHRGWLGVSIQDVTEKIAKKNNLKSEDGAYVADVVDDSPADSAGLKKGDIIVEFAGKRIDDSEDLTKAVGKTAPGTKASVVIFRDGEKKTMNVVVGNVSAPRRGIWGGMIPGGTHIRVFGSGLLGLRLSSLNEQLGEYFGAPNSEGVLVEEVEKGSSGEKAGFKAGDVIVRVEKKSIDAVEDISRALERYNEGDKVEFEVVRKGAKKTLSVEAEEASEFGRFNVFPGVRPRVRMFRIPHGSFDNDNFEMQLEPGLDEMRYELENMTRELKENAPGMKWKLRDPGSEVIKILKSRSI